MVPVGPVPDAVRRAATASCAAATAALARLLHVDGHGALVRAWVRGGCVRLRAEAATDEAAKAAVERMRFALGTDHDLSPFHRAFARDPLLGPVLRRRPWLRPRRRPEPFEALAWAICEQLIDGARASAIERRLVSRHGARSACGAYRDVPSADGGLAPEPRRGGGLRPVAQARDHDGQGGAGGGIGTRGPEPSTSRHGGGCARSRGSARGRWRASRFHGQGRDDQLPAGDLAYIKLVGRLARLGRRATEDEVREFFAPVRAVRGAGRHVPGARDGRRSLQGSVRRACLLLDPWNPA